MKMILFENLNPVNFKIAGLFKMFGFDVRYFRLDPKLKRTAKLEHSGFKGLSFEEIPNSQSKVLKAEERSARILLEEVKSTSAAYRGFQSAYRLDQAGIRKFESLHFRKFIELNHDHIVLLVFLAHYLDSHSAEKIHVWSSKNRTTTILNRKFLKGVRIRNLNPRLLDLMMKFISRFRSNAGATAVTSRPNAPSVKVKSREFDKNEIEICFFPHKGVFYGDFYVKNQFYGDGKFRPDKILHLSLGESPQELQRSHRHYLEKGIPFADLFDYRNVDKISFLVFWMKNCLLRSGLSESFFYFSLLKEVETFRSCLNRFPKLRFALVGYDMLFDASLAFALHLNEVETIGNQERFLSPWFARHLPIIDHYFVLGEVAKEKLLTCDFITGEIVPVGPVRLDDVRSAISVADHGKYSSIKKNGKKILLALDYHSAGDAEENRFALANHWSNNKKFYTDLIRISEKFPELEIVIKGKDFAFLSNPFFSETVAKMNSLPNISVEKDYVAYTPERMLALSDICVCLYTSLADEAIAAGIPTIIYDFFGYPSDLFNFEGAQVVVRTSEKLLDAVDMFTKTGEVVSQQEMARLQTRFYSVSDGSVKAKIQSHLQRIVHNS